MVPCSYHICIKLPVPPFLLDNTNLKNNPCWKAVLAMKKKNTNKGIYSRPLNNMGLNFNNTLICRSLQWMHYSIAALLQYYMICGCLSPWNVAFKDPSDKLQSYTRNFNRMRAGKASVLNPRVVQGSTVIISR